MIYFQKLATSPEVKHQKYLNSTAILSVTNLIRNVVVDNKTASNYYPVHAFGQMVPSKQNKLHSEFIPYLSHALRNAVSEGDSHQIQVYIRALGNLGSPSILNVFEPYLEGQSPMSTFQRTLIVVSMDKLAKLFPAVAQPVLFKIYENVGEAHPVRCAAVFQLMYTYPSATLLQRMAYFTHVDPSYQARAAVKSAIQSAALLEPTNPAIASL